MIDSTLVHKLTALTAADDQVALYNLAQMLFVESDVRERLLVFVVAIAESCQRVTPADFELKLPYQIPHNFPDKTVEEEFVTDFIELLEDLDEVWEDQPYFFLESVRSYLNEAFSEGCLEALHIALHNLSAKKFLAQHVSAFLQRVGNEFSVDVYHDEIVKEVDSVILINDVHSSAKILSEESVINKIISFQSMPGFNVLYPMIMGRYSLHLAHTTIEHTKSVIPIGASILEIPKDEVMYRYVLIGTSKLTESKPS